MKRDYEVGSGNVFADLGFRNAEQELLKARLTLQIHKLLKQSGLTQGQAAKLLRTTQPQISALMGLKPVSVSIGRLLEFLQSTYEAAADLGAWDRAALER